MADLTPGELDILERVDSKPELRPFFFRKAKGVRWFDALEARGYLCPDNNRPPAPAAEEGYITVPLWPATEYLVATSPEFKEEINRAYAERTVRLIRAVTQKAKDEGFSNYKTWWQFSKIVKNIPISLLEQEDLACVDYWLEDPYDRGLVASEIGEQWLPALLQLRTEKSNEIALKLIRSLYTVKLPDEGQKKTDRNSSSFRFDNYYAGRITNSISVESGRALAFQAIGVFKNELCRLLELSERDEWSTVWRPAIEDHPDNLTEVAVEDFLVSAIRDAISGWVGEAPEDASKFIRALLKDELQIIRRIGIYSVWRNFNLFPDVAEDLVDKRFFRSFSQREMWNLLHDHFRSFPDPLKTRVVEIIDSLEFKEDDDRVNAIATAFQRAIWISSIKDHDSELSEKYLDYVNAAGSEPTDPGRPVHWTSRSYDSNSPKSAEQLLAMPLSELIEFLSEFEDPDDFFEPGVEGLLKALKGAVKAAPGEFYEYLREFGDLDSAYIYTLIEAYSELWSEKEELPWHEIWPALLGFCETIVLDRSFWSAENAKKRTKFVANRHWIVGAIGRLIENGTKLDEHALPSSLHSAAFEILGILLDNQGGEKFSADGDAVFVAINSPRGHCIRGLINLSLRAARLSDKEHRSHEQVWEELEPLFVQELDRAQRNEYEFVTLVTNYLPNFIYLSSEWVFSNLGRIFSSEDYQHWLCAMQGYSYSNLVHPRIFEYFKANGDLLRVLDDTHLKEQTKKRVVEDIALSYLNALEDIEEPDSLMRKLLERRNYEEINHLIWFFWTMRDAGHRDLYRKVLELWPSLIEIIDTDSRCGRKLASRLTTWSGFISEVDETNRELIVAVAPYADADHNGYVILESISRIAGAQPKEAAAIWMAVLEGSAPDFPEEAVREAFRCLLRIGPDGRRTARSIADRYIKWGNVTVSGCLEEMIAEEAGGGFES